MAMTISFHGGKRRFFLAAAAALLAAVVLVLFTAGAAAGPAGAENSDRVHFLQQCGWQVEPEPLETRDLVIPVTFSPVYQRYSELNRQAGFDLRKIAGKACHQYVYRVTNYADAGRQQVRATLLVCDGRIAGGDVATVALNGFMLPLRKLHCVSGAFRV